MKKQLPSTFRKMKPNDRRNELQKAFSLTEEEMGHLANAYDMSEVADRCVESCIGTYQVPFGLATGFLIDGIEYTIPMATEEPSVILGASYAASIIKRGGGFKTSSDDPIATAQVFINCPSQEAELAIDKNGNEIRDFVNNLLPGLVKRGGGFRGVRTLRSEDGTTLCVSIDIDVCDAMGANIANEVAEKLKPMLEKLTQGIVLMGILTNSGSNRLARASFSCSGTLFKEGVCEKIAEATRVANLFPERAITHNKGVMNGITALALATGNDTRAIEAGAHFHAQRTGSYRPLTNYHYSKETGIFTGEITLPIALGTVGGSIQTWPLSQTSLKILDVKSAKQLAQIAAAVGLAQNLAALMALVTEGIQSGHMKLHKKKENLS